jgi:two-component system sensor histidine kinase KdpD
VIFLPNYGLPLARGRCSARAGWVFGILCEPCRLFAELIAVLGLGKMQDVPTVFAEPCTGEVGRGSPIRERVLVAMGADIHAERVIREGKRIADLLEAPWTVVYVETPDWLRPSAATRDRRIGLQRLAESLGAENVTIDGLSAAQSLLEYAHTSGATRIVIGAPKRRGLRSWTGLSTTAEVVRQARGFDVICVGNHDHDQPAASRTALFTQIEISGQIQWNRYLWALVVSAGTTGIAFTMYPFFALANIVMAYVLASTIVAMKLGRGPAILASIANVLAFALYFVSPRFTLSMADVQYVMTLMVMLVVAVTIANLMASVRQQVRTAGARERRTALLYAMSRELAATRGVASMAQVAVKHIAEVFNCKAVVLVPDDSGTLHYPNGVPIEGSYRAADLTIAQWVIDQGRWAGLGSARSPTAPALYLPLTEVRQRIGVLAVLPKNGRQILQPEQRHLLETFAEQLGLAMERARLSTAAEAGRVAAETESLRNTLLASISHDLRTPLAAIAGAGGTLAERGSELDDTVRTSLARSIETKAREMTQIISNVLDLIRFESGQISLRRDWHALDELIGSALARTEVRIRSHPVRIDVPNELPALHVDGSSIVQVLTNVLDNATKYTPDETRVHIAAQGEGSHILITVDDEGPGFPGANRGRLFDKFQRGTDEGSVAGAGLGLAICRAIVRAHGGDIWASDSPSGGARVQFSLPLSAHH